MTSLIYPGDLVELQIDTCLSSCNYNECAKLFICGTLLLCIGRTTFRENTHYCNLTFLSEFGLYCSLVWNDVKYDKSLSAFKKVHNR